MTVAPNQLATKLRLIRLKHEILCNRGMVAAGNLLLSASLKEVPVDTGALKASGHVRTEGTGFRTVVFIGYGGVDFFTPFRYPYHYAVIVHQIPMNHPRGGKWKYLEDPLNTNRDKMAQTVYVTMNLRRP